MDEIYMEIDKMYIKISDLLSIKKIEEFSFEELNNFKKYFEELFKICAKTKGINEKINFIYQYTKNIQEPPYHPIVTKNNNTIEINLDEIISLQSEYIKKANYSIDLFISQVLLTKVMYEVTLINQALTREKGTITLENYLISKKIYCEIHSPIKDKSRLFSYYENLEEGTAYIESILFTLNFLEATKRNKVIKNMIDDEWTWNNIFAYYYSIFPFSCDEGKIINNEEYYNEIIKKSLNKPENIEFISSYFPILKLEINEEGKIKDAFEIIKTYYKEENREKKKEILNIFFYILIPKLEIINIELLIKEFGIEEIFFLFRELYSVTEEMKEKYKSNYHEILEIINDSRFNEKLVRENDCFFNKEIVNKKYEACLMDINIKQSIIDDLFNKLHKKIK